MKKIFATATLLVALSAFTLKETNYNLTVSDTTINWIGRKVTGEHKGTIKLKDGTLTTDGKSLTGGTVTIDMTTINVTDLTGDMKAKLEGHLKSDDFFNTTDYPAATLKITKVVAKKDSKGNTHNITGDLTIKGKTNPVTFPASVSITASEIIAKATIIINRSKYDVKYGSSSFFDGLGDKVIYDDFDLNVELKAKKI